VLSSLTEAIVTSEESKPNAEEINKLRTRNGLEPLKIFIVPTVKSEDGLKISSSRIRAGLIDKKGKVTIAK
jgi:pantetheine-phosphate adenylyltransferase